VDTAVGVERVLRFMLEGRAFALPVDSIVEVVRHSIATPVPRSSPAVEGIVPMRGRMVTVVDLRKCLALPSRRPGDPAQVIVVDAVDERIGLVVDHVTGVSRPSPVVSLLDVGALLRGLA